MRPLGVEEQADRAAKRRRVTHRVEDVELDPEAVEVLFERGRRELGCRARTD